MTTEGSPATPPPSKVRGGRASSGSWALNVVEACYRVGSGLHEWLRGIVEASTPALEFGYGVGGQVFQRDPNGDVRFLALEYGGNRPPECLAAMFSGGALHLKREELDVLYSPTLGPFARMSDTFCERLGRNPFRSSSSFTSIAEAGVCDFVAAYGIGPEGRGYTLAASLPEGADDGRWRADVARWRRLRAHLLAAMRLHATSPREEDAVLTPAGRIVHAQCEARTVSAQDALRTAAMGVDRARTRRGRSDPDAALEAWQGLVSGRWSLVDRFDSDGRRYIIARRNDPLLDAPRSLTPRERQVLAYTTLGRSNKEIAYELGLSVSTVSTHLSNARRRLRIDRRMALASCGTLCGPVAAEPKDAQTMRVGEMPSPAKTSSK